MKDKVPMIMSISTMEDIKKLKNSPTVKYLNLDIQKPDLEVIYYLIENGEKYSYSDMLDGKKDYIYVSYEIFKSSQLLMLDIINNIPTNLTEIEIARYLYIKLGRTVGYDINVLPDKNETFNLKTINTIHNIWGSLNNLKGTNVSFAKTYLYLCRIMEIDCQLITVSKLGYLKNQLTINGKTIITDITQDIPFIQGGFKTKYFLGYNDIIELDKKIGYIKDTYNEEKIEEALKGIDYNKTNIVKEILLKTQNIINASDIKPIELGILYDIIFKKSHYLDNEGQENVWSQYLNILNEIFKKENNNKQPEEEYDISFNKEQSNEIVCNTILLLNQTKRFKYLRENYKKFPQLIFYLQYLKTQDKKNEIDIEADLEDINNWAQKYKHDDHSFENPINMYENAMRQIQRGEINIFVAMPYYNYETIKQYNSNYQKIVSTIIKKNPKLNDRLKLFPIMTHKGETKNILDDIDECIENCQIFIADVSDDPLKNNVVNPNVMYELGVARQKSKPCIIIKNAKNDSDLIFDIKPMSVYFLNFDNPDVNFVPEMVEHIEEIIKKYYIS